MESYDITYIQFLIILQTSFLFYVINFLTVTIAIQGKILLKIFTILHKNCGDNVKFKFLQI